MDRQIRLSLRPEDMFIDAKRIGIYEKYKCVIPIFGQAKSTENTWFLGRIMLQHYYTIFDATGLD